MTPGLGEIVRTFLRIGLLSFGGPAGQIATMHRILVDEKKWLDERRFLHALNYCMLLPGPEAQQLATYAGWLLYRNLGGLIAGVLFVLPGFLTMMALSALYAGFHGVGVVQGFFDGIKPAVLAVVVQATFRIGGRTLKGRLAPLVAVAAFLCIFAFNAPFPLIVLGAGVLGVLAHRHLAPDIQGDTPQSFSPSSWRVTGGVALVCLALWWGPVALFLWDGHGAFGEIGLFFSKMAVVTFGGAYAALAYVAQQAVDVYGWLRPGEMLDGLGLAETTPGPLILVTQFVGFLAGFRDPGGLNPWLGGVLGASLTVWVTFMPSFLLILVGAPFVERLRGNRVLAGALAGITASVVGVILNLALWFALHVVFTQVGLGWFGIPWPRLSSIQVLPAILAVAALVAMLVFRVGMVPVLAVCGLIGAVAAVI